jgi:hypothetical protein
MQGAKVGLVSSSRLINHGKKLEVDLVKAPRKMDGE